jgi:hypothetical protein
VNTESPSWEDNNRSVIQEILSILWNPNVYYRVHKNRYWSLSYVSWNQSTSSRPASLRSIWISSYHIHLVLPSVFFPSALPTKIWYPFRFSPIHATFPVHLILLDFNTLVLVICSLLLAVSCFTYFSVLKMEALRSSETSVNYHCTMWFYIPENCIFYETAFYMVY